MNKNIKKSHKLNTLFFIVSIVLVVAVMFIYIGQKEGFHEDEIYSYGSANYKYNDTFYASGDRDAKNRVVQEYIIAETLAETIENIKYYRENPQEFSALEQEEIKSELPVWKTPEDVKNYLFVNEGEQTNYISPYYNQARDVHPPLFYFLVHFVCSLFVGTFSKYTIFAINLVFLVLTILMIRKILILFNREKLVVPATLFYGLSMGAVSMTMFLRMYALLTFFVILYFYVNLKITKNDSKLSGGTAALLIISTVLGFLTQYYFCIFALFVFLIMLIRMIKLKNIKQAIKYSVCHVVSAVIGIGLFPSSIGHIFSSSRGIGSTSGLSLFTQLEVMVGRITYAFSLHRVLGVLVFLIIIAYIFVRCVEKTDAPDVKAAKLHNIFLFVIPVVCYVFMVSKLSPNLNEATMVRYITPVLPIMAIAFLVFIEKLLSAMSVFKEKGKQIVIGVIIFLMTVSGFLVSSPSYLYKGYNEYLEVAENHKDLKFVYVYDNYFTHLNSLPEMMIYEKTLIINLYDEKQKNTLIENDGLKDEDAFVLSIKKWMDTDEALKEVLSLTGFSKAEVLLDNEDDTQSKIYLISK